MLNRLTPIVKNLIIVNVAVYIIIHFLLGGAQRSYDLEGSAAEFLLLFRLFKLDLVIPHNPSFEEYFQPVQIVTHFFNHGGLMHIFFNMFVLALIGPGVEMVLGSQRFLKFYLFCGVVGGLLITFLDPSPYPVVGASGAIYGVMVAFAMFFPREKFYLYFLFPIEARWFVIAIGAFSAVMVAMDYAGSSVGGQVSHFGHLAGMVCAVTYFYLRKWVPFLD